MGTALKDCAADALHWSSFAWADNRDPTDPTPIPQVLRQASGKPVIVNGGIAEGAHAEAALSSGAGDLCAVGRPLFAHPDWSHIIRSGETYDWTPFDRQYVIRPPVDFSLGYPFNLAAPNWDPDLTKRRSASWMDQA